MALNGEGEAKDARPDLPELENLKSGEMSLYSDGDDACNPGSRG